MSLDQNNRKNRTVKTTIETRAKRAIFFYPNPDKPIKPINPDKTTFLDGRGSGMCIAPSWKKNRTAPSLHRACKATPYPRSFVYFWGFFGYWFVVVHYIVVCALPEESDRHSTQYGVPPTRPRDQSPTVGLIRIPCPAIKLAGQDTLHSHQLP